MKHQVKAVKQISEISAINQININYGLYLLGGNGLATPRVMGSRNATDFVSALLMHGDGRGASRLGIARATEGWNNKGFPIKD